MKKTCCDYFVINLTVSYANLIMYILTFQNPVATSFEIFWMMFEPVLFSLTGTQIRIDEIDPFIFKFAVAMVTFASVVSILLLF